jgi:hypothetical protein
VPDSEAGDTVRPSLQPAFCSISLSARGSKDPELQVSLRPTARSMARQLARQFCAERQPDRR